MAWGEEEGVKKSHKYLTEWDVTLAHIHDGKLLPEIERHTNIQNQISDDVCYFWPLGSISYVLILLTFCEIEVTDVLDLVRSGVVVVVAAVAVATEN